MIANKIRHFVILLFFGYVVVLHRQHLKQKGEIFLLVDYGESFCYNIEYICLFISICFAKITKNR